VERTPTRLIDILSEVEAAAMILGRSKEIHLEFNTDPAIQLSVDHHLLFSAISNLVSNAMKFTKPHGKVLVRSKESGGRILIEVEDECGGLSEGEAEELFKSFAQKGADKTGMGLGLPLSRRAIELNQGTLTARNIPEKGCVFTIDLPKAEEIVQSVA
jgi:signal transduction histidine kinase